jgi:acylglycerol lipase
MLSVRVCFALFLLLGLAGCATPFVPARAAAPTPAPPGVVHADGFFQASDGLSLYEQSWRPEGKPKGVLVIVHGLKDHSARYAAFADELVTHGYAVYAFDLRGHGRSAGQRVYVRTFDQYLADLDVFLGRVRAHEPGEPLFLFGHSMGGAIVTLYTITRQPHLQGVLLSGAALRVDAPSPLMFGTRVIASIAPSAGVFQLDAKTFSRDPAVVRADLSDPLVYQPGARSTASTTGWSTCTRRCS